MAFVKLGTDLDKKRPDFTLVRKYMVVPLCSDRTDYCLVTISRDLPDVCLISFVIIVLGILFLIISASELNNSRFYAVTFAFQLQIKSVH